MNKLEQPLLDEVIDNNYQESYFPSINGASFQKTASKTIYDHYLGDSFSQSGTLYIICGTDSGLLPRYLIDTYSHQLERRHIIFVEFDSVIEHPVYQKNIGELPEWMTVVSTDSDAFLKLREQFIEYFISRKVRLLKSLTVIDNINAAYGKLWKQVTENYMQLQYFETYNYSQPFVDAQLRNLSANITPILKIKDALKGRKALLLGGGPSIDHAIDWIKKHRDKFIIFSVGRIAPRLIKEGLVPDFFVSADPHEVSFDNSKQMLFFSGQSVLLNCYHVVPRILNQWSGPSAYYGPRLPWEADPLNSASPGPTVIHSALNQAVFLGCKEIYLAGVDMCFYQGQTHESGSAEKAYGKLAVKHLLQVETYSGELAETDMPFAQGIQALKAMASAFSERFQTQIYNLSDQAAFVEGIDYINPDNIHLEEVPDKQDLMTRIWDALILSDKERVGFTESVLKAVQKERKFLIEQKRQFQKGIELAKKIRRSPATESKVVALKNKLDKKLGDQAHMLFHYGYQNFANTMKPVEDEAAMSMEEIEYTLSEYFSGMLKTINSLISELDETIKMLKFRLLEYGKSKPSELATEWRKRHELGRTQLWQEMHILGDLSEVEFSELQKLQADFNAELKVKQTTQSENLKKRAGNWKNIFSKVHEAFNNKNASELKSLEAGLVNIDASELMQEMALLIQSMLYELKGDDEQAVSGYANINHVNLKLFALKRILHFAMKVKDHNKVLMTLEQLIPFSKDYLVPYADYMVMLDQPMMAVQILQVYLKEHQENVIAWVKLADLAYSLKQEDIFNLAFEQIKTLSPDGAEFARLESLIGSF
ncbi:MAG: 6-hydroxymethylpterin diphosphokinase MptE-like protein [Pseudomonadota bacterium]|nr:6-hydroxymethylpterin diphosphokinase MptE-like protein [Pseudomonadota bacterium]